MASTTLPTVLFLHPSDELYGADRQLLALVRASRGLSEPLVLLPEDAQFSGGLSAELRREGVSTEHGPLPVLRRRYGSSSAMIRWLPQAVRGWWWTLRVARDARARAIVSNSSAILVGPSLSRLLGIPHVWFVREVIESPAWYKAMVHNSARLSRGHVYAVSDAVTSWLGPIGGRGPSTLHDGVTVGGDVEPLRPCPVALFVGRMNAWKGWDLFLEAAAMTHERVPEARFRLVGGVVPGAAIDAVAVQRELDRLDPSGSWLEWSGELPSSLPAMRESWLVAVPSIRPDPFPNVVLEAMAEGRAVVGSATGGIPEMIVDGETGRLIPPGESRALADAMSEILADQSVADRLGLAGRQRVSERFSTEHFGRQWTGILSDALSVGADRASD